MNNERHYLSTREAAEYLGLSSRTLDRYRVSGEGPVFHRFGRRVRYTRADLDAWAKARRREGARPPPTTERCSKGRRREAGEGDAPRGRGRRTSGTRPRRVEGRGRFGAWPRAAMS